MPKIEDYLHCARCDLNWPTDTRRCDGCSLPFYQPITLPGVDINARGAAQSKPLSATLQNQIVAEVEAVLSSFGCTLRNFAIDGASIQPATQVSGSGSAPLGDLVNESLTRRYRTPVPVIRFGTYSNWGPITRLPGPGGNGGNP